MEELQQPEARKPLEQREHDETRHLHEGLAHAQPAAECADPEADDRLRQRLHAKQPARGRVLQQPGHEAGAAAEFGPAAQREQHHHDQGDVGRHVRDTQGGADGGVGHPAAEHGDREKRAHQPSLLNEAATSRAAPPVRRSTSSMRAKSTAGVTCA